MGRFLGVAPKAAAPRPVSGARGSGGPVQAGRLYRVGERGPELFAPGRSGMIIPNHRLGGVNVSVNAPITITVNGGHPGNITRIVETKMREALGAGLRGALADTGMT